MKGSLTLLNVKGIPIRAHFTLLFLLPYLAFLMSARFQTVAASAGVDSDQLLVPPIVWGGIITVALFVGILLHELGHSLVALRFGGRVRAITLMFLGGVSQIEGMPPTASVEALIAVAGPVVSLMLGLGTLAINHFVTGPADVKFGLFYFGQINLVVAIFNLLPAFPMDGGRVLRALLAMRWSRQTATRIAAGVGAVFAAAFVALGLTSGNIMLLLIGFFVWSGARAEVFMVERADAIRGLVVRDVMEPTHASVQLSEPLEEAALLMARSHTTALPVLDGEALVGVVAAHHVEAVRPEERARTSVAAVVAREAPPLEADEPLTEALEEMAEHHVEEAPVLYRGMIVGVMDTADMSRMIRLKRMAEAGKPLPSGMEDIRV